MDHQRLARTLLRLLGIWLIAHQLPGFMGAIFVAVKMWTSNTPSNYSLLMYPIQAGLQIVAGVVVLEFSGTLSKIVSE